MEEETDRELRLACDTNDVAQQIIASGELRGHAGIVRISPDALPDFQRKHWTTTCFLASGRITLVHIGEKDMTSTDNKPVNLAADELDSALAMKHPFWSEGWMASLKRDWWAYKHHMRYICQRNYYQARKPGQERREDHKKDDSADDLAPLDVSSWPGRWAVIRFVTDRYDQQP